MPAVIFKQPYGFLKISYKDYYQHISDNTYRQMQEAQNIALWHIQVLLEYFDIIYLFFTSFISNNQQTV